MYLETKNIIPKKNLIVFFLALFSIQLAFPAAAHTVQNIEDTNIKLSKNIYNLKDLFKTIEDQTDYSLIYTDDITSQKTKSPINSGTKTLKDLLNEVAAKFNVAYQVNNDVITFKAKTSQQSKTTSDQQKVKITGKITDEANQPIPGVSVAVQGTANATQTDMDGNYSITVETGQTIVFSYLGFKTVQQPVTAEAVMNIALTEEAAELNEMVITALGIKREEKALGYAVQKVQGATLQTVKGVDVATSLTGKVAGMLVKNSTEFTEAPTIELRGETPLLVIDGVPYGNMTLREIPADDIETINVLKGATASALYGYRGASGAIVVTTKKGSSDREGLSVSLNSSTMLTAGYLAIPEQQTTFGRQINAATNTYTGTGAWGVPMEGQDVIQWDPISKSYKSMPYTARGKDNFKNFLQQGYIFNNNLSITQHGEHGNIRSSATWVNNRGQYPNSQFDKYTYTLAGDINIDKFKLTSSISLNKQTSPNIGFNGYTAYDPMYNILVWSAPDYDIRDYKDYWLVKDQSQNNSYTGTNNNPYFDRYERTHSIDRQVFNGFVSGTYAITPWLNATLRTGFDTYNNQQAITVSQGSLVSAGAATVILNGTQVWGESLKGSYSQGLGTGYSINQDFILTANKKFGDFDIDGLAGETVYYTEDKGIESETQGGLSIPGFYSIKASVNNPLVNTSISKRQVNSIYGRLGASWKSMLFLEGTLRNDWSSTLPESTRSYLYPSVATSFLPSEILPKYDWLSFWKVRGSWTSSKTPAGVYDINSVYTINNNAWGTLNSASYPDTIRNSTVNPQSSDTWEAGTAASLFKSRFSLDFTYYSKRMYDFLTATGVSSASGFNSNYINTNEQITRRGIEITATVMPVKTKDWQWNLTANWSKYARYYTKLDNQFSADNPWVKVGNRVDAFVLNDFQKDSKGNIIYENGLPVYSAYQSVYGHSDPDWIWGLTSSLHYKNFALNISVDGRVGGLAQSTTEMYMWQSGNHPDSVNATRYLDVTTGTANYVGSGVKVVSGSATYDAYGNVTSDTRQYAANDVPVTYQSYVQKVHKGTAWGGAPSPYDTYSTTFIKLRELSLSYTVPQNMCKFIGAKSASVSAIGQNLFMWAKDFKYSDPDSGVDNFSDPSQRFIGGNIKLEF